ncbi:MAG: MotA/TolQ/ExbB proton channel family protein [Bdellovibrionota bacterium]
MLDSVTSTVSNGSFIETLIKGGWVMVPLLLCSFATLAVIIERLFWGPTRARVIPKQLQSDAAALLEAGRVDELLGLCRASSSPLARIMSAGLRNVARPRAEIVEAMEIVGKKEAFDLQRYLGVLGTVAAIGPLLGLLGTVFGMISTFHVISLHGTGNPALMADGIAEALVATATGLSVAIPSLLFYRFFLQRTRHLIVEMEVITLGILDELETLQRGAATHQPSLSQTGKDSIRGSRATV